MAKKVQQRSLSQHASGGLMTMAMICCAHNDLTISAVDYRVVLRLKMRNNAA